MSEDPKEKLKRMLESRFKFYCRTRSLERDEKQKLAEALTEDLITNEWETLKAHLEYHKAQGFYNSKECWAMIQRARDRLAERFDIMEIYPLPDAIVHALLDTGD